MPPWLLLPAALAADLAGIDSWDLVRVDRPDLPGALTSSDRGSLLDAPPSPGTPWRHEPIAEPDGGVGAYDAWEAADAMGVPAWHEAGWRGQGVRIAVFDVQWFSAGDDDDELGSYRTHDCYAHSGCAVPMDTLRPHFGFEEGSHGISCAEIVRDLAPDAELDLVRVSGLTTLENAVAWAVREQVDIVSMSLSFFNDSFYDGSGPVSRVVEDLAAGGVLLVTSAGNYAEGHWVERFHDPDGDGDHDFPWGSRYLPIWLRSGTRKLYLTWDDYLDCGSTDLDAWLYDERGVLLARGDDTQDQGSDYCSPLERLRPQVPADEWTWLRVQRRRGDPDVTFAVLAPRDTVWRSMPAGSVTDPGTHPLALAVGAVRADGYLDRGPEAFSSQGPTASGLPKPDLAAPDGLTTSMAGPTGFYGTSAAAPSAAAAVALVMSRYPELDPYEAAARLATWADDGEPSTWQAPDPGLGAGRIRLPDPAAAGCGTRGGPSPSLLVVPLLFAGRRWKRRRSARAGPRPLSSPPLTG